MTTENNYQTRKKPLKVVSIGKFNPDKPDYHPDPDEDQYYVASWAATWAVRTKARYPDLDIEVWRTEPAFSQISYRKVFGVDCTIFPAKRFVIPKTVTIDMLRRLYKYTKDYNLVFHKNTIFDWRFNILMPLFFPSAKIVLSHHGGVFPKGSSLKARIKRKILKFSFRNVDAATYLRNSAKEFIKKANNEVNLHFLPVGAKFDHFKPLDKIECRKKLNLPLDKVEI